LKDAKEANLHGVAVVTRKGPFMAGQELFVRKGFEIVDSAPPDFSLLVYKFNTTVPSPVFKGNWEERIKQYGNGLTIIRADQCPYTVKNIKEISEAAEKVYGITPKVITLANYKEAQKSPCAFGTFCIISDGNVIAFHPISKGRFLNIMKEESQG
jgi:hypothetical protein